MVTPSAWHWLKCIVPAILECNKDHTKCADEHKDAAIDNLSEDDKGKVGMGLMCAMKMWPKDMSAGGAHHDDGKKFLPRDEDRDHPPRDHDDDGEDHGPRDHDDEDIMM